MEKITIPEGYKEFKIKDKSGFLLNLAYFQTFEQNTLLLKNHSNIESKYAIAHARQSKEDKSKSESSSVNSQISNAIRVATEQNKKLLLIVYGIDIRASGINHNEKVDFMTYLKRRTDLSFYLTPLINNEEVIFDLVYNYDFTRIAREHEKTIREYGKNMGVIFYSTNSPNDELVSPYLVAQSEVETRTRSKKVVSAQIEMLEKNIPITKFPIGYLYKYVYDKQGKEIQKERKIIIDIKNASIIRNVYQLRKQGLTLKEISKLNPFYYKYNYKVKKYFKVSFKSEASAIRTICKWLHNSTYKDGMISYKQKKYKLAEPLIQ